MSTCIRSRIAKDFYNICTVRVKSHVVIHKYMGFLDILSISADYSGDMNA